MRKWYVPMTMLGLGSIGVLLFTDRGRRSLRWIAEHLPEAQDQLAVWNETAQRELDRIQSAINTLSDSLQVEPYGTH